MRRLALALLPLLAACGSEEPPADQAGALALQLITYPDIEANGLHGPSCSYGSGKSMGAVVMAMDSEAVVKIDGRLRRFALDPQCDKLEKNTGSRYLAPGYVLDLAITGESKPLGNEKAAFEGTVKLSDEAGRVLYSAAGHVQCSG